MSPVAMLLMAILFILEVIGQTMFSARTMIESCLELKFSPAVSGDLLCTNAGPTPELRAEYNAAVEWTAKVRESFNVDRRRCCSIPCRF